ncbi:hypothetical protein N7517_003268 [Penicillium concentricum]|uniref:Uncharacterized protein n=1 Tax=Penicillium concentricum TaxID=293559 RepID=A0A9W9SVW9_9EURO|nr:uncharacterized protein N7517_003268 [Penicillium concentricum]KAJ5385357.1 hypothetical protein N7517_003268 [Penicillium concentricum]
MPGLDAKRQPAVMPTWGCPRVRLIHTQIKKRDYQALKDPYRTPDVRPGTKVKAPKKAGHVLVGFFLKIQGQGHNSEQQMPDTSWKGPEIGWFDPDRKAQFRVKPVSHSKQTQAEEVVRFHMSYSLKKQSYKLVRHRVDNPVPIVHMNSVQVYMRSWLVLLFQLRRH